MRGVISTYTVGVLQYEGGAFDVCVVGVSHDRENMIIVARTLRQAAKKIEGNEREKVNDNDHNTH